MTSFAAEVLLYWYHYQEMLLRGAQYYQCGQKIEIMIKSY